MSVTDQSCHIMQVLGMAQICYRVSDWPIQLYLPACTVETWSSGCLPEGNTQNIAGNRFLHKGRIFDTGNKKALPANQAKHVSLTMYYKHRYNNKKTTYE